MEDEGQRIKLPKNASRIVYAKGLPFKITSGSKCVFRISGFRGIAANTRGSAYVVYDDILDAKNAVEHLNGFNVAGRYISVNYFDPLKFAEWEAKKQEEEELRLIRERSGFA